MRILVTAIAALLIAATSNRSAVAGANVSILNPPPMIAPGEVIPVQVSYTKTPNEPEKRVIVRVDLHDYETHEKVTGAYVENNGTGYTGVTRQVTCPITIPASVSGKYYFKATISPWSMNRAIVQQYKSYPTNGIYTYAWIPGHGVTQDVFYMNELISPKAPDNTCYCSGLAFETFVFAFNNHNQHYGHSQIGTIHNPAEMRNFRVQWYGVHETEKLATLALPMWNTGMEITDFEEAQEGDNIQLWRTNKSGHNPLFVNWIRNSNGQITGVRYWGSQGSSNGIGYHQESFATGRRGGMLRERFYLARAKKPRDQADYDWALGSTTTTQQPSQVPSSAHDWMMYN